MRAKMPLLLCIVFAEVMPPQLHVVYPQALSSGKKHRRNCKSAIWCSDACFDTNNATRGSQAACMSLIIVEFH
jgi:hypothetical protein